MKKIFAMFLFFFLLAWCPNNIHYGDVGSPALTYIDSNQNGADTGTDVSITHGLSINSGDLLVVSIHNNTSATLSDNNGSYPFTENDEDGLTSSNRALYWRIAGSSEPATYHWTLTASQRWAIIIIQLRAPSGYSVQNPPIDVGGGTPNEALSTTITATSITVVEHSLLLAIGYADNSSVTFSAHPSGMTVAETRSTNQALSASYLQDSPSGSTGSKTWTIDSSYYNAGELISFLPGN